MHLHPLDDDQGFERGGVGIAGTCSTSTSSRRTVSRTVSTRSFASLCRLTSSFRHARSLGNDGLFVRFRHLDGLVGEFGNRLPARDGAAIDHDPFVLQSDLLLDRCFHHVAPDTGRTAADRPLADRQALFGQPDRAFVRSQGLFEAARPCRPQ